MLLLLAVLLAFLAQNLLTPSPLDFLGVCIGLSALGAVFIRQQPARHFELSARRISYLILLSGVLIVAWQLFPPELAAILCMLMACVMFVQAVSGSAAHAPSAIPSHDGQKLHPIVIALVMLASLVLCVYDNAHIQPGLHGDEAESGIEARNINAGRYDSLIGVGWYDQPLWSFFVQAVGLRLFGDNISGLRTTSAVVGVLTLPLVYLLARRLFAERIALITFVLMAFAHWFIAYARLGINYNQTTLLEVLSILTFWQGWQTRKWHWFLLSGIVTGAGLYLYFASRLVPLLLLTFAGYVWLSNYKSQTCPERSRRIPNPKSQRPASNLQPPTSSLQLPISIRYLAIWLVTMALVFLPMGLFFLDHTKEFSSRASSVFLFSDSQYYTRAEKMKLYAGTDDVPTALIVQGYRYAALFNAGGARDGQYGNTLALLDYYTAVFFVLGFAYALYQWRQPRFMLLLLWFALTVFVGGVLTIEAPFTPRLVGLMPVPFMLAAITVDRLFCRLWLHNYELRITHHTSRIAHDVSRFTPYLAAGLLFSGIIYFNYWSYFDHYIHSIDGWAQREPATTVAKYAAQMQGDQTMYVVSAPELYVWHGTIRFFAPNLRGYDLSKPDDDLPIRDPLTQRASFVILPQHMNWLERLQAVYPHGEVKEYRRPWGDLWFVIYEVSAEEIERGRN